MKNISVSAMTVPTAVLLSVGMLFSGQTKSPRKDTTLVAQQQIVEWKLDQLNDPNSKGVTREGDPRTVDSPYGKAVHFDGVKDGLFLETNPLENLSRFTVEILFQPDGKAPHEQRFLHMGDARAERLLLETRVTDDDQWCLDAFLRSGDSSRTLIDRSKLHPTGTWYHIAYVVDNGKMDVYLNSELELRGNVEFSPMKAGRTSIGMRMNKVSWFKGSIYKIRVTPKCLIPAEFMKS
jgi:hypothetical protein